MAFRLPTFADVGFDDPRAVSGKPNFPASDPGAEGLGVLGKGAQAAGNALREYAEDAALKNDKLNESNATLDLFTRLSPLQTKIDLETDTDKIAEHRAEINSLLQTSGNALAGNPARQKAWMASHVKTILEANRDADKRTTLLYRNKSSAASGVLLDRVTREGVESDDPQAFSIALQGIDTNLEYQGANGDKLPVAIEEERKRRRKELVEGRVLHLTSKGKLVEAQALLDTQGHLIADSIQRERFGARIAEKAEKFGDEAELNRRWGGSDKGYAGNRGEGGMQVGGASAKAIRQMESGSPEGDYSAIGPVTRTGDRAYGAYQVMGANIPSWTEKHYGERLTAEQFLRNNAAQDAVFRGEFGRLTDKYGADGASRAWFAGEGGMNNSAARDVTGTSVSGYNSTFSRLRDKYSGAGPKQSIVVDGKEYDSPRAWRLSVDAIEAADPKGRRFLPGASPEAPAAPAVAARGKGPDRLEADQNDAPASGEPIPLDSPGTAAVAPSVAALPDIDTMIAEVQADADSGAITQKRANFVMAGLRGRYNRIHAAQANDRAALTKRLSNGLAALEDGREFEVDPALVRHHFPKEKADEILLAFQDTKEAGQITAGVRTSSLEDLDRQQQQITAGLADQNAPDYVRRRKLANAFGAAVDKRSKELSKDPAAYVAMYSPPVAEKYAAATDPAQPQETAAQRFSDYATAALAEQGRLGLPEESRAILPKGVATAAAEKIAAIDPAKQNPGTALAALARSYGAGTANDHWPQVLGELVKAKLPGTYQVLATMDRPDQAVAAGDLSRAIGVIAEKGGMSALKKSVPDDVQKEIDKRLDESLADFRKSTGSQSGGARLYATVRDAAQALAYYHGYRGKSESAAVQTAVDGIINAKYDFGKVGADQVRVPKGTLGVVERAADVVKAGITVDQLGTIPGNQLVPPEKRAETWLGAIQAGGWANNENDSGLVLMGRFRDNSYHAVRRADGSRVEVKFDAAATLAASAPIPQGIPAGTDAGRLSEDYR